MKKTGKFNLVTFSDLDRPDEIKLICDDATVATMHSRQVGIISITIRNVFHTLVVNASCKADSNPFLHLSSVLMG